MENFKELFEAKFNPSKFKRGDRVIVKFETVSGHLTKDKLGVVTRTSQNGLWVEFDNSKGNETFQEMNDDKVVKDV